MEPLQKTPRTTLKRIRERGTYDRATANAILDEGLIGHVGFSIDGQPIVIPMAYARDGDSVILHGSAASRLLRGLAEGVPACLTVTLLDGVVLARSVFESSMNYRSLVALGVATAVTDIERKMTAMHKLTERLVPGRWEDARQPTRKELNATSVLEFPLREASVKTRSGPPQDLDKDVELPIWGGVIPLALTPGVPLADEYVDGIEVPDYVTHYVRA